MYVDFNTALSTLFFKVELIILTSLNFNSSIVNISGDVLKLLINKDMK